MSLKTWKEEFYPKEASRTKKSEALDHSIQKWIGLRKENLVKHGVTVDGAELVDGDGVMLIGGSTCALCHHHSHKEGYCHGCPLSKVREGVQCDVPRDNEKDSPYFSMTYHGDPEPMILDLLRAKRALDEGVL